MSAHEHEQWMTLALREARLAAREGEVPVGAILVMGDVVVGRGHNRSEASRDATAHAEMLALQDASSHTGAQRLNDATMYVTLEPCPMCLGAMILARVGTVVYGSRDPKFGACGSVTDLLSENAHWNHTPRVLGGVRERESSELMQEFFRSLRK